MFIVTIMVTGSGPERKKNIDASVRIACTHCQVLDSQQPKPSMMERNSAGESRTHALSLVRTHTGPFFCPVRSGARRGYPMAVFSTPLHSPHASHYAAVSSHRSLNQAPPARNRTSAGSTVALMKPTYSSYAPQWEPMVSQDSWGYLSEWPYVQTHTGRFNMDGVQPYYYSASELETIDQRASTLTMLDAATESSCTAQKPSVNRAYYVYDPFQKTLREEYLECSSIDTRFEVAHFSGSPTNTTDYKKFYSKILFRNSHYKDRLKHTLECMEKFKKQCTSGAGGSYCPATDKSDLYSWWEQVKTESTSTVDRKAPFVIEVGECVDAKFGALHQKTTCDCHENEWENFPLKFFHAGDPIMQCMDGPDKGNVCSATAAGSTCAPVTANAAGQVLKAARCEKSFAQSYPLSRLSIAKCCPDCCAHEIDISTSQLTPFRLLLRFAVS